ncbi:MAG TPA: hypothetical protein VL362_01705 [Patescibacteria group bacterium]|jgi:cytochrome o ubiquinol oxidase operon protein cyoD|nr:hypothetical protein [Patescibacteria group bacterium]
MSAHTPRHTSYQREYRRYVLGLIVALAIVYVAYFSVVNHWFSATALAAWLLALAAGQFLIQLLVFLHVGEEAKPRWTLWSILYTMFMMLIVVVASLWIMANMNYNMGMSPEKMQEYMLEQNQKGF